MLPQKILETNEYEEKEEFQRFKEFISYRNNEIENSVDDSKIRFSKLLQSMKQITDLDDVVSYNNFNVTIRRLNDHFEKIQKIIEEHPTLVSDSPLNNPTFYRFE